jgi:hypothetical protein
VEHQDLPVALVKAVLLELRELEDLPEQVELQAKAVHLDLVDHLVNQELLDLLDPLVNLEQLGHREVLVLLEQALLYPITQTTTFLQRQEPELMVRQILDSMGLT